MSDAVPTVLRLVIGGLFVYAGLLKAISPAALQHTIESYALVPTWFARGAAAYLPYLEMTVGGACILRRAERSARVILLFMTAGFVLIHAGAWWRSMNDECGCFGPMGGQWLTHPVAVALNGALFLSVAWLEHRTRGLALRKDPS